MAEVNEYRIVVDLSGGEQNKSAVAGTGSGSTGSGGTESSESSGSWQAESSFGKVENKLKSLVSFAAVKSTADKLISNRISTVSLRTGANEYEQRLSFQHSVASQVVGAGAALAMGFSVGGPAGLAVAGIGLAVSAVQKFMDIQQKEETLRLEKDLESVSIGMQLVRAGSSGRRASDQ